MRDNIARDVPFVNYKVSVVYMSTYDYDMNTFPCP